MAGIDVAFIDEDVPDHIDRAADTLIENVLTPIVGEFPGFTSHILIDANKDPYRTQTSVGRTLVREYSQAKLEKSKTDAPLRQANSHPFVQLMAVDTFLSFFRLPESGIDVQSRDILLQIASLTTNEFYSLLDYLEGKNTTSPLSAEVISTFPELITRELIELMQTKLRDIQAAIITRNKNNDLVQAVIGTNLVQRLDQISRVGVSIVTGGGMMGQRDSYGNLLEQ